MVLMVAGSNHGLGARLFKHSPFTQQETGTWLSSEPGKVKVSEEEEWSPPPPPSHHWVNWLSNNHFLTWPLAITGIKRGHVVWQIWLSTVSPDPPSAKYARLKWAAGAVATRTLAALDSGRKSESNYKNYIIQLLVTITRALILGIKYKSRYLERLKWVQPWNAAETINMWHASINQI